ncbi:MAG: DUF2934 domain-containing protein [Rhizobiales bacterium]|nr:DUF2934 domain-containing protein [Hyphomicrobiales bacterium]
MIFTTNLVFNHGDSCVCLVPEAIHMHWKETTMTTADHIRNPAADTSTEQVKAGSAKSALTTALDLDAETNLEEQKRLIAYQLWEDEGRPEGKAEEHWSRACELAMSLDEGPGTKGAPEWLQRQQAAQAIDPQTAKQAQSAGIPPSAEAPLDAIRRRIAERKTA